MSPRDILTLIEFIPLSSLSLLSSKTQEQTIKPSTKKLILHILKKECLRRHGFARLSAAAACHDGLETVESEAAAAHINQGADNGTYHVAEETVGGDLEIPFAGIVFYPPRCCDFAQCRLHVRACLAERREIGDGEKMRRCLVHQPEIEVVVCLKRIASQKRRLVCVYIIMICARLCAETCVHIVADWLDAMDGDVGRHEAVETAGHLLMVDRLGDIEMRCHLAGMDAGVGAPGSDDIDVAAEDERQAALKLALDGDGIRLFLPTVVAGAVVGEMDEVSHDTLGGFYKCPPSN